MLTLDRSDRRLLAAKLAAIGRSQAIIEFAPDGTIRPALEVRSGQAGFFTRGELDDSAGTLWKPEEQEIVPDARVDPPAVPAVPPSYDRDALAAFADGRPWDCERTGQWIGKMAELAKSSKK